MSSGRRSSEKRDASGGAGTQRKQIDPPPCCAALLKHARETDLLAGGLRQRWNVVRLMTRVGQAAPLSPTEM